MKIRKIKKLKAFIVIYLLSLNIILKSITYTDVGVVNIKIPYCWIILFLIINIINHRIKEEKGDYKDMAILF